MDAAVLKVLLVSAVFLVVAFTAVEVSAQTHHVVGGWGPDLDVSSWLSGRVFKVGDKIWFKNSGREDSIMEVGGLEEFVSCNLTNPIRMYTHHVPLDKEGIRYFTSANPDMCKNGLKLPVSVHPHHHSSPSDDPDHSSYPPFDPDHSYPPFDPSDDPDRHSYPPFDPSDDPDRHSYPPFDPSAPPPFEPYPPVKPTPPHEAPPVLPPPFEPYPPVKPTPPTPPHEAPPPPHQHSPPPPYSAAPPHFTPLSFIVSASLLLCYCVGI